MDMLGPTSVADESHGRLGMSALLHSLDPTTQWVFQITFWLGLAVLAIAIIDLLARGRFRNTTLALSGMMVVLAPLMGVYAAANTLLFAFVEVADRNIADLPVIAVPLAESAFSVAVGALFGAGAVVLRTVLLLVEARRPSSAGSP